MLVALGVIFIPALLDNTGRQEQFTVKMEIPPKPEIKLPEKLKELQEEQANLQSETVSPPPFSLPDPLEDQTGSEHQTSSSTTNKSVDKSPVQVTQKTNSSKHRDAKSEWIIQVGSFSRESNALGLRDSLLRLGQKAFVEETSGNTGVIYRVRIGPVADRESAEKLQAQLAKLGQRNLIIMPYP